MDGLRVLVTRDRVTSEDLARELAGLGALPRICPAIEIRYCNSPGLETALQDLSRFDWLVLTSANAARAIETRFRELGIEPVRMLARTRIAAVGKATGGEILRIGGRAEIVASSGSGAGLVEELVKTGISGHVILFPASRIARPQVPEQLRVAGAEVVQFSVYETSAPKEMVVPDAADIDIAIFASPSAVRNVLARVGPDWFQAVPAACIGETTAGAAREAGAREVVVAPEPSMAGIIAALLEFHQRSQKKGNGHGRG